MLGCADAMLSANASATAFARNCGKKDYQADRIRDGRHAADGGIGARLRGNRSR